MDDGINRKRVIRVYNNVVTNRQGDWLTNGENKRQVVSFAVIFRIVLPFLIIEKVWVADLKTTKTQPQVLGCFAKKKKQRRRKSAFRAL